MAKILFLLRHAKSSRDAPQLGDAERPLNKRGQHAAASIGKYMANNGLLPRTVLCSPAVRTLQTWEIVAQQLSNPPAATICPELYDFGNGDAAFACIRKADASELPLMIVAHNPALHSLAQRLIIQDDTEPHNRLAIKFPTGALAVISFNVDSWQDISEGTGKLEQFVRPKDLDSSN
jgi:phosphohistidine phosphatase